VKLTAQANAGDAGTSAPAANYDWEAQYRAGDLRWDKGAPAPGLVDFLVAHPELPPGTVLVPGCGSGHDARAWAAAGWQVTGLDLAPTGVALARRLTTAAGRVVEFVCGDFLADTPSVRFDWLFEHTLYCAIDPARRGDYARAVPRWLKPGGHFLALHYLNPEHPDGPPWGVTRQALLAQFTPAFELLSEWVPRSFPNRAGREWMLWWRHRAPG
jgi:SAM-dependent methyltransferase